jgi:hypothetical protein
MIFEQRFARRLVAKGMALAARTLRVTMYCVFGFGCLALLGAHVAQGDISEASIRLGKTLERFSDLTSDSSGVLLNGATMRLATAVTDEPVEAVLDRYEKECKDRPGVLSRAIREAVAARLGSGAGVPPGAMRLGVVRSSNGQGGMVVCFADDRPSAEMPSALDHVRAFLRTHDLAAFGSLRYAMAHVTPDGRTRVRTIWTEGPLPIDSMFPAQGDAPGSDSALAPRPPDSRRLVAAAAQGEPYAVRTYRSTAAADDVRAFYDDEMARRGFSRAETEPGVTGAAYVRDGGLMVFVAFGEADGATTVTVVDGAQASSTAAIAAYGAR